jgi:hypothetical protein
MSTHCGKCFGQGHKEASCDFNPRKSKATDVYVVLKNQHNYWERLLAIYKRLDQEKPNYLSITLFRIQYQFPLRSAKEKWQEAYQIIQRDNYSG